MKLNFNNKIYKINLRDEADKSVFNEIFKYRSAEKIIQNAKNFIVDAGAHAGFFTIYARGLNPLVKIIALEPEPANLEALEKHLKINNIENVEVLDKALAGKSGRRNLLISPDSHNHSLVDKADGLPHIVVDTISIAESLNRSISLLKMDIEGGEFEIIENLDRETAEKIGAIILEYHDSKERTHKTLDAKLRELGFGVETHPSQFDRSMGFIFATNKKSNS
jgi:FkbM family methyltransferase